MVALRCSFRRAPFNFSSLLFFEFLLVENAQSVAIDRALMNEPEIIFADESTGNLQNRGGGVRPFAGDQSGTGKTIIMATHSKSAADYGERIIWVQDGEIISLEAL